MTNYYCYICCIFFEIILLKYALKKKSNRKHNKLTSYTRIACFKVHRQLGGTWTRTAEIFVRYEDVALRPSGTLLIQKIQNIRETSKTLLKNRSKFRCRRFVVDTPADLHSSEERRLHDDHLVPPTTRSKRLQHTVFLWYHCTSGHQILSDINIRTC